MISDEIWSKLMWAGLNLQVEDLPSHSRASGEPRYPLELVRAVAMLWLFAGLRTDEIYRLRVGAIRWQTDPETESLSARCPREQDGTPFTKPVDRIVGEAIETWEQARPPQRRFPDRKTGQPVDFLPSAHSATSRRARGGSSSAITTTLSISTDASSPPYRAWKCGRPR